MKKGPGKKAKKQKPPNLAAPTVEAVDGEVKILSSRQKARKKKALAKIEVKKQEKN